MLISQHLAAVKASLVETLSSEGPFTVLPKQCSIRKITSWNRHTIETREFRKIESSFNLPCSSRKIDAATVVMLSTKQRKIYCYYRTRSNSIKQRR
jgi:hypothetical protein